MFLSLIVTIQYLVQDNKHKGMYWEKGLKRESLLKIIFNQSGQNLKPVTIWKVVLLSNFILITYEIKIYINCKYDWLLPYSEQELGSPRVWSCLCLACRNAKKKMSHLVNYGNLNSYVNTFTPNADSFWQGFRNDGSGGYWWVLPLCHLSHLYGNLKVI